MRPQNAMSGRSDDATSCSEVRHPPAAASAGRLRCSIRRFGTDTTGGAAVVFCVLLVPLLGFAGFALDYARVSLARVDLQAAVDSAGLAIALLPRTTPIKDVQQRALDRVNASLAGKGLGRITLEATRSGTNISFSASSSVDLTLFKILHKEPVALTASNEVSWDLGRVEVALVLDNTGSMVDNNSPKLANLKTAANSLVGQLQQAATDPNQVKIGIVPFSMTVNVGPGYAAAPWLDQNAKSPVNKEIFYNANPNRFTLLQQMGVPWGGCVESRPSPYDVQETAPDELAPETLYVPFLRPTSRTLEPITTIT